MCIRDRCRVVGLGRGEVKFGMKSWIFSSIHSLRTTQHMNAHVPELTSCSSLGLPLANWLHASNTWDAVSSSPDPHGHIADSIFLILSRYDWKHPCPEMTCPRKKSTSSLVLSVTCGSSFFVQLLPPACYIATFQCSVGPVLLWIWHYSSPCLVGWFPQLEISNPWGGRHVWSDMEFPTLVKKID